MSVINSNLPCSSQKLTGTDDNFIFFKHVHKVKIIYRTSHAEMFPVSCCIPIVIVVIVVVIVIVLQQKP